MSRLDCALGRDKQCVAGYDVGMATYFFISGRESSSGIPTVWLGRRTGAFPDVASLEAALGRELGGDPFKFDPQTRAELIASSIEDILREKAKGRLDEAQAGAMLSKATTT